MSWLLQLLDKNSPNPSLRLELAEQIIDQLGRNRLPSDSKTLNEFCDVTFQWMAGSNFKVSLQAIEVLHSAVDISGDVLAPYLLERAPSLVERLGDSKPQVRDAVTNLLVDLAGVAHSSHQVVLEKISPGFVHKQWLVKCGCMNVYRLLLDESREELEIQTNRLIPTLCKLMADPNIEVRETSMNTLVHVMIILGNGVATSIRNRRLVPETKMQLLMQRYEDALKKGSVPSQVPRPIRMQRRLEPRAQSAIPSSRNGSNGHIHGEQENLGVRRPPPMSVKKTAPTPTRGGAAGAVTEEDFRRLFNDVPRCTVTSREDVRNLLSTAKTTLENTNLDWDRRQNALKTVRSVVINGGNDFERDLVENLMLLEDGMTKSITDLRSQICKEACVTACFLTERLGGKLIQLFERLLPHCVPLIQNSAKVMSTSGTQACDFIVKNIQTPKILMTVLDFKSHKSKEIRGQIYHLINQILTHWPQQKLDRHADDFVAIIKQGISDADPTARKNGRDGYQQLERVFPHQAQVLFRSLDSSKQKALNGASSAASSAQSISSLRDAVPMTKRPGSSSMSRPSAFMAGKSASAIDSHSVKRATASSMAPKFSLAQYNNTPQSRRPIAPLRSSNSSQPGSRNGSPTRTASRTRIQPQWSTPSKPANGYGRTEATELFTQIKNLSLNATNDEEDWLSMGTSNGPSQLQAAIKKFAAVDVVVKKEGLKIVHDIIRTSTSLSQADAKAIGEGMIKLLAEGNHKIVSPLTDAMGDLVTKHHQLIADQLYSLLTRLIHKYAQEIMPTIQNCFKKLLDQVRASFGQMEQLMALCKFIDERMTPPQTPKARKATVTYMGDLVAQMETGSNINKPEVQSALRKIFQWMEDPKNAEAKPACERLIAELFNLNTADLSSILATFPPAWKEHAYSFLQKNGRKESDSVVESPRILPSGIDMADCRQFSPSLGPLLNNTGDSEDGNNSTLETTGFLADDETKQNSFIKSQLKELACIPSKQDRIDVQMHALRTLHQMVSEGSFTTWNENFKPLLIQLFDILALGNDKKSVTLKRDALRLITKLCTAQAARFYEFGAMVVTKVLNVTVGIEDSWFLNVVDECLKTLASHLPIVTVLSTLNPVISSGTDNRIPPALKMLQRLVESADAEDLKPFLPEFVPGVVRCYASQDSIVRKNTVFTLVALVNKLGREAIDGYLIGMEPKGLKLMEVYIQRTQTASTHF